MTNSGMTTIEVSGVTKTFGRTRVVDEVSFTIAEGEIFGMVGPNGAGKTTTMRMLMDILKPDSGEIRILGQPLTEDAKNRLGYLPEERGLYKKTTVTESLIYLAALKGVRANTARARSEELLGRVDMLQHKDKKIEELSRGMGQIIQFIATILHSPDVLVLDEPFSGLDPVNTELLKGFIKEQRGGGRSVILSTHVMNQVEELCDRFLMIDKGRAVLYGSLQEIKAKYRHNSIFLECDRLPDSLPGVIGNRDHGTYVELFLDGQTPPTAVLAALVSGGVSVSRFEVSTPSLNEIFIQVVRESR